MAIAQLPSLDFVTLELAAPEWRGALQQIYAGIRERDGVVDSARAWEDLLARSTAGFTALNEDIALPHARTAGVTRLVFAAGRHDRGVAFGADAPAIRLIFLVLTPKERPNEYLQMVAGLSRRLRDAHVRDQLIRAANADEFTKVLEGPGP